jgi:hypothetical protein
MADSPYTLRVESEDEEVVLIEGLEVVRGFLGGDLSAKPGGYNDLAGTGDRARISVDDVRTVNKTMRSRAKNLLEPRLGIFEDRLPVGVLPTTSTSLRPTTASGKPRGAQPSYPRQSSPASARRSPWLARRRCST